MDNLILSQIPLIELLDQVKQAVREEMAAKYPTGQVHLVSKNSC